MPLTRIPCYRCDRLKAVDEIAPWSETFKGPAHHVRVIYRLCLDCMERDHPKDYDSYLDSHDYAQRRALARRDRRRAEREQEDADADLQRRIDEAVARIKPQPAAPLSVAKRAPYTVTDWHPGLEPPEPRTEVT